MSGEVIRRHTYGETLHAGAPVIGIASLTGTEGDRDRIRILRRHEGIGLHALKSYAAVVSDGGLSDEEFAGSGSEMPVISNAEHLDHISEGDVLRIDFRKAFVRSLYRTNSPPPTTRSSRRTVATATALCAPSPRKTSMTVRWSRSIFALCR